MSSSTRDEVLRHLQAVVEIEPPVQQTGKAIYPAAAGYPYGLQMAG